MRATLIELASIAWGPSGPCSVSADSKLHRCRDSDTGVIRTGILPAANPEILKPGFAIHAIQSASFAGKGTRARSVPSSLLN